MVLERDWLRWERADCGAGRSRRGSGGRWLGGRLLLLLRTFLDCDFGGLGREGDDVFGVGFRAGITAAVMRRVAVDDACCRRGQGDGLAPPDVVWTAGVSWMALGRVGEQCRMGLARSMWARRGGLLVFDG